VLVATGTLLSLVDELLAPDPVVADLFSPALFDSLEAAAPSLFVVWPLESATLEER